MLAAEFFLITRGLFELLRASASSIVGLLGKEAFWVGLAVGAMCAVFVKAVVGRGKYRTAQVHLNLPFGLGNVVYEPADQDRKLAWEMYLHLKTRKAALPFDEENDLIAEVYDSLKELFQISRELLAAVPLSAAERPEGVPDLILRVLNDGLRPHLTKWQAAFRRWWEGALAREGNNGRDPQTIQREYPLYSALVEDFKRMNVELAKYAEDLVAIVRATPSSSPKAERVITAEQPSVATEQSRAAHS